jgi:hypothetical protein
LSGGKIRKSKRGFAPGSLLHAFFPVLFTVWGRFSLLISAHLEGPPGSEQLEQIVGEADQLPFRLNLLKSTQQKPTETTPLLNLPEHWLHNCLAHPVQIASCFRFQLLFHWFQ